MSYPIRYPRPALPRARAIALNLPTVIAGARVPGGSCYVLFPDTSVTAHTILTEKARGEWRKLRAGGATTSTLAELSGGAPVCDETCAAGAVENAWHERVFELRIDDERVIDLSAPVALTRRTVIEFVVAV